MTPRPPRCLVGLHDWHGQTCKACGRERPEEAIIEITRVCEEDADSFDNLLRQLLNICPDGLINECPETGELVFYTGFEMSLNGQRVVRKQD